MSAAHVICNSFEDREHWLRERKKGLGGSDAPGVLSIPTAYSNQPAIYVDKTNADDLGDNEVPNYVEFGHVCEQYALGKLAAEMKGSYALDGNLYQNDKRPWQLATIDGLITTPGHTMRCEVKSTAYEDKYEGVVPPEVFAQVQHQISTLEEDSMYVCVVFRISCNWKWQEVIRDDEFIDTVLLPAEASFWQHVTQRDPQGLEVTQSERCRKALAGLHGYEVDEPPAELGAEADGWADEIVALREEISVRADRKELLGNRIRNEIGDRSRGFLPSGRYFNYKYTDRKAYNVAANRQRNLGGPFGKEI